MNELRDILIFLSVSFRKFFTLFLLNLVYFFIVIILTSFTFFFSFHRFGNYRLFVVFIVILIVVHLLLKGKLFFKMQMNLNLRFVDFLRNRSEVSPANSGSLPLSTLQEVKKGLKKDKTGFFPNKLLLAVAVVQVKDDGSILGGAKIRKLKKTTFKYMMVNVLVFFVTLLPFLLISFMLTREFNLHIQLMIHFLGFLFVYFLNMAVFDPIFYLIVQAAALKCR